MNTLTLTVGDYLFEFRSFAQWCDKASSWFRNHGVRGEQCICVDARGRICRVGAQFMRAHAENAFPIKVYEATTDEGSGT